MTHKKPVTIRWWIGQLVGCGDHFTMCIYTCIYQNQVAHIKYITIYKCQLHPEKINLRKLCLKKKSLTSKVSQNCIIWNFSLKFGPAMLLEIREFNVGMSLVKKKKAGNYFLYNLYHLS